MEKETKENIIGYTIGIILVLVCIGPLIGFFIYVPYRMNQDKMEMHERIRDNINLSKPFNEVIAISSDFISGADGWYFVSILTTTDDYPGSPQWIYDFRYNNNNDVLYYDDDIKGIGVKNI